MARQRRISRKSTSFTSSRRSSVTNNHDAETEASVRAREREARRRNAQLERERRQREERIRFLAQNPGFVYITKDEAKD